MIVWGWDVSQLVLGEERYYPVRDVRVDPGEGRGDRPDLVDLHPARDVDRGDLEGEAPLDHLRGQSQHAFVRRPGEPAVDAVVVGLDVEPEGVHPGLPEQVEVPRRQAVAVRLEEDPEAHLQILDQLCGLHVELRLACQVAAREGDYVPGGAPRQVVEQRHLVEPQPTGAVLGPLTGQDARAAAAAELVGVPARRALPGLLVHVLAV